MPRACLSPKGTRQGTEKQHSPAVGWTFSKESRTHNYAICRICPARARTASLGRSKCQECKTTCHGLLFAVAGVVGADQTRQSWKVHLDMVTIMIDSWLINPPSISQWLEKPRYIHGGSSRAYIIVTKPWWHHDIPQTAWCHMAACPVAEAGHRHLAFRPSPRRAWCANTGHVPSLKNWALFKGRAANTCSTWQQVKWRRDSIWFVLVLLCCSAVAKMQQEGVPFATDQWVVKRNRWTTYFEMHHLDRTANSSDPKVIPWRRRRLSMSPLLLETLVMVSF